MPRMSAAGESSGPTVIKHYELERQLGKGAMGSVWVARDRRDNSKVAVKLLHPHLGADPEFRARFEREAHVAALLRSPYTVHLLDYGVNEGTCYLVMEFVDGHAVSDEVKSGPMEPARALRIATEIARALEEAGARGVVHRDIKPDNVLVDQDDRVKVTDFGIARQSSSAGMTTTGIFVGTPAYAAPEQADGNVDPRSDIYALGATLFALLAGHPPFRGASVMQILEAHKYAPVPMAELAHLPDPVVNVVRRCMEKDPRDRYQSATELVGALERAAQSYAQFRQQQGGTTPQAAGYTAPRAAPSTIPVTPPTQPSPRPVPPRQPPPEVATRVESRAAPAAQRAPAPAAGAPPHPAEVPGVTVELAEKAKPGRDGLGRYTLTLANSGGALLRLRLVPTDASGVLQVNVPGRVAVPPGTTVLLDVTAQPRVRRTRGPDRRLGFGVTAVDEATGGTVGSGVAEYPDIVERGGGSGRLLAIAGVVGVAVVVAVFAAVVFLAGGGDSDNGGNGGTTTPQSPTTDTRPAVRAGEYTYNLHVTESTCTFGSQPGTMHTLTFAFDRVGGGDVLRTGDQVQITGIADGGARVALGRAPFAVDGFVFTYPVTIGNERGMAELSTVFTEASTIASATLVETYGTGTAACSITATQ
jgi:serine/threonine protein kinase